MQILKASDGVQTPWRNGGGVTREVAAWPPGTGAADFDWRISIATVSRGGPFSAFPGVDRELAVLEGVLRLSIHGRDAVSVGPQSPSVHFPGDVPTSGEPQDGPVMDLNVMTRRGKFSSRMTRLAIEGRCAVADRTGGLAGGGAFIVALAPITLSQHGNESPLAKYDIAWITASDVDVTLVAQAAGCVLVEILPRLAL